MIQILKRLLKALQKLKIKKLIITKVKLAIKCLNIDIDTIYNLPTSYIIILLFYILVNAKSATFATTIAYIT